MKFSYVVTVEADPYEGSDPDVAAEDIRVFLEETRPGSPHICGVHDWYEIKSWAVTKES